MNKNAYIVFFMLISSNISYAEQGDIIRVSVDSNGNEGEWNKSSGNPNISDDGRYITFTSFSTTFCDNDTNNTSDVFVHDRNTGNTVRVSFNVDGKEFLSASFYPSISGDGKYITFENWNDIYLYNTITRETILVSEDLSLDIHSGGNSEISDNGRFIVYEPRYIYDVDKRMTSIITIDINGLKKSISGENFSISDDGRYIAFETSASDLVPNDTNYADDVFVYDRENFSLERVSVDSDGQPAENPPGAIPGSSTLADISGDGRYVTFVSNASSLFPKEIPPTSSILWGVPRIYVHDRQTKKTILVSGDTGILSSNWPSISNNGKKISFSTQAKLLSNDFGYQDDDIYIFDSETGNYSLASYNNPEHVDIFDGSECYRPSISGDGNYVAFESYNSYFVPNDMNNTMDIFLFHYVINKNNDEFPWNLFLPAIIGAKK